MSHDIHLMTHHQPAFTEASSCLSTPAVGLVMEMARCHTHHGEIRRKASQAGEDTQCEASKPIQATMQFKMFISGIFYLIF